jgi:hypothetical protein
MSGVPEGPKFSEYRKTKDTIATEFLEGIERMIEDKRLFYTQSFTPHTSENVEFARVQLWIGTASVQAGDVIV